MGTPGDAARVRARPSGSSPRCTARPELAGRRPAPRLPHPRLGRAHSAGDGVRWSSCSTTTRTSRRCSPSTAGSASRSSASRSTAPATAATATVWGGEILLLGADSHRLHPRRAPGAGAAARRRRGRPQPLADGARPPATPPGIAWDADLPPVAACPDAELTARCASQLATGLGCVPTTSMGRLFDAVASLLGVRHGRATRPQAAIELEALAGATPRAPRTLAPMDVRAGRSSSTPLAGLVRGLVAGGVPTPATSAARAGSCGVPPGAWPSRRRGRAASQRRRASGVGRLVGLTGGVFQNVLLLRLTRDRLHPGGVSRC